MLSLQHMYKLDVDNQMMETAMEPILKILTVTNIICGHYLIF